MMMMMMMMMAKNVMHGLSQWSVFNQDYGLLFLAKSRAPSASLLVTALSQAPSALLLAMPDFLGAWPNRMPYLCFLKETVDNYITKFDTLDVLESARARLSEKAIMLCKAAVMGDIAMNIDLRWWCNLYEKPKSFGSRHVL
jgi:hypothetical protein